MRLLCLLPIACGGGDETGSEVTEPRTITYDNDGAACLRGDGTAAEIRVDLNDCLDCVQDNRVTCRAVVSAGRIEVTASGKVVVGDCSGRRNTCSSLAAHCQLDNAGNGSFELRYGEDSVTVILPTEAWVCTGPAPGLRAAIR